MYVLPIFCLNTFTSAVAASVMCTLTLCTGLVFRPSLKLKYYLRIALGGPSMLETNEFRFDILEFLLSTLYYTFEYVWEHSDVFECGQHYLLISNTHLRTDRIIWIILILIHVSFSFWLIKSIDLTSHFIFRQFLIRIITNPIKKVSVNQQMVHRQLNK